MKGLYVEVKIDSILRQYIQNCLQSDVVKLPQGALLIDLMRPYLAINNVSQQDLFESEPEDETDMEVIRIELPLHNGPVYNANAKKVIRYNGLFRTKLTEEGQAVVRRHFKKLMRLAFHTYMDGHTAKCEAMNEKKVKQGVTSFLLDYSIDFTEKDVSTVSRDWFRYRMKNNEKRVSPILS